MKTLIVLASIVALSACSAQQAADTQTKAAALAGKISNAVQVGCTLDGKFVPIGQDAAAVIAPAVGVASPVAGTLVMSAVEADKALVHPAVLAVCKSLLGALATPAAQVVPDAAVPATPAAAKPAA